MYHVVFIQILNVILLCITKMTLYVCKRQIFPTYYLLIIHEIISLHTICGGFFMERHRLKKEWESSYHDKRWEIGYYMGLIDG